MVFFHAFAHSIKLPKKNAIFQLNRIGMDIAIIYMLFLNLLVSIPSFVQYVLAGDGVAEQLNLFFKIIYYFIFHYLPLSIMVFALLSIIAGIGTLLAKLMDRKLKFAILWKMTVFTTTIPFLLYALIGLFFSIQDRFLFLFCAYSLLFLFFIISVYPKRRKK
ncbi:hypothetical protein J32TS6_35980 [Virgibacillus pantothenticus]|uniref:DUF1189 domain-containing protein n=1 Tax=Virgibacillus pantothenticus TaxID=1473 RepID=A0A0L0QSQ1_VIRPA|nr:MULTISPECIES: DUF1189 family protein [Virgibacillus]API92198.1 hypothetical protein BKP57_10370 [Virgibacillus sp. 6R]KNE21193.1 hypothetical protein AFK71_05750 [Virgibacillus pantothenticus]MBS7427205.1 DUF1189 family protein [Virgibacillus sp. 19R1-5]MBU8567438.1 DUF1189 domain-containing protein [Virgibacillus pantothenticus]MBU8601199.1 DUF1189 domain-containing protein [Virgibacillus pantothenticus]